MSGYNKEVINLEKYGHGRSTQQVSLPKFRSTSVREHRRLPQICLELASTNYY